MLLLLSLGLLLAVACGDAPSASSGQADDDTDDDNVSWEEADYFDANGIKVEICQYYGTSQIWALTDFDDFEDELAQAQKNKTIRNHQQNIGNKLTKGICGYTFALKMGK